MKNLCLIIVVFAIISMARATDIVIGISPWLTDAQREDVRRNLDELILKNAPGGTHITVTDAWNLRQITDVTVPTLQTDIRAARAMRMRKEIAALADWFKAGAAVDTLRGGSGLRTPEWFQEIGPRHVVVILIGNPLYLSPTEPAFAMTGLRYPSDGHLACTASESVYGIAEKKDRLAGTSVHWVIPGHGIWGTELHRERVTRFWCLWIAAQGGSLVNMSSDLPLAFRRAFASNLPPVGSYQRETEEPKPEMMTAEPRVPPDWIRALPAATPEIPVQVENHPTQTATLPPPPPQIEASVSTPTPPVEPPVATTTPPTPAVVQPPPTPAVVQPPPTPTREPALPIALPPDDGKTFIGIAWNVNIDLDLHVQPAPGHMELCWIAGHQRSSDGRFNFDYRRGTGERDYEFVELVTPLNRSVCRVTVNYYSGRVRNPAFQVFIRHAGHTYLRQFTMNASSGNHRGDANHRETSNYWVVVDLNEVMKDSKSAVTPNASM